MLELNKIYNEDCLPEMKNFPDKYFDWCIADPPYGINADSGIGGAGLCANNVYTQKDWDSKRLDKIYFDEMKRIQNRLSQPTFFDEIIEEPPKIQTTIFDLKEC